MLTKQDFDFLAKFVRNHSAAYGVCGFRMARDFADWIASRKPTNDLFDRTRFMDAALDRPSIDRTAETKLIGAMFVKEPDLSATVYKGKTYPKERVANPLRINFPD